jgi:formimidoylglutamate deiminase
MIVDGFADLVERAGAKLPQDGVIGIAPHSLRAVTPDELGALLSIAKGGPVHIHIAEQVKEVEDCVAWSGRRPVRWLLDAAPVDARWTLVHATHVDAARGCGHGRARGGGRACARSPRRIWATGCFPRAHFSIAAARSVWGAIRTCGSMRRRSCGCSNMASG